MSYYPPGTDTALRHAPARAVCLSCDHERTVLAVEHLGSVELVPDRCEQPISRPGENPPIQSCRGELVLAENFLDE
jgi:hypothetical protein